MKDRFTTWLLLSVAFVGGLAAMVFVAGWRPDEPADPAAEASTTALAVPEARTETTDVLPPEQAAPSLSPAPPPRRHDGPDATGARVEVPEAPARADSDPVEAGASKRAPRPDDSRATGGEAPAVREMPRNDPEPSRPRDDASKPSAGGAGQAPGFATRSPAGREISSTPKSLYVNPAQGSTRSSPRSQSTEILLDPSESNPTGVPPDAEQGHSFEDGSASGPDSPWTDEPRDEHEQDREPEQDPESEVPRAIVRLTPAAPEFAVDQIVPVTVEIFSGTDVGHVPFYVNFDPRVLRFARGEEGPFLGLDGVQTMFVATLSSGGDAVVVGLSRLGQNPGIDGNGRLCVLYFEAVAPGTSNLRFNREKVKDSTNRPMPADFVDASVTVTVR